MNGFNVITNRIAFCLRGAGNKTFIVTTYLVFEIVEPFLGLSLLVFQLLQCGSQGVQFTLYGDEVEAKFRNQIIRFSF